ncbi:hypothetical protein IJ674_10895 [bacterium]|jgi:hypothetical protein|nr:hypothetical protein [bacterium]MBR1619257.1 hypothetical protein [bacterium]MBR1620381.1 hypothetical protein [bacterium]
MVHINKAQIVNLNPTINKDKKLSQNFNLKELIKKLTSQAENYIKKDEYYRQIDVGCEANDPKYYAKGIAFSIQKDNTAQDKHMLWVSMLHPSMQVENSKPLAYGNKEEIVKFLKDEKSLKQIEEKLNTLSEELKNN